MQNIPEGPSALIFVTLTLVKASLLDFSFATEDPFKSSPDDLSRLASWIESKLVICYLKLGQPGLALHHSHRSIIENPSHFCNHLRQAACFRCLHRYSEAARSAMVAQCLYVLAEGAGVETSDLLQLYWQAMTQEALSGEISFSVLYTPFEKEDKADKIKEANKTFAERHPEYVQHIFTDPHGIHLLPEKAESHPGQQYLLTLGFRNKEIGKTLEKFVTQKLPIFPGVPTSETFWQSTGKRIMAAVAFIGSTKIKRGPCARAIEQFHHASLLSHLHREEEQAQVMTQVMAELATVPYLQRVSAQHLFWPLQAERAGKGRALYFHSVLWKSFFQCGDLEEFSNPPPVQRGS
uniref:Spermatogenesis associated 16 n=1 Tax=Ficedula albicollis TaxID=59894 RepID=A0A803VUQ8_FICAL